MRRKTIILLVFLITMVTLTGCWDVIESDKRAYVMSLGIDKYEPPSPGENEEEPAEEGGWRSEEEGGSVAVSTHAPRDTDRNRYTFTYALPSFAFIMGEGEEANIFYHTVGQNLYSASRILTTRLNRQVFFGHMQAIVIGEAVARDPKLFREILDAIERDPFISRRVDVTIASGNAKDVLTVEPNINPLTGEFIADIFRNKDRSPRSGGGIIGDVLQDLHRWGNTVIPRIIPGDGDIKVAGSAVIKNYQMVGWLGEIETRAVEIIRGTAQPGGLTVIHEGEEGHEHIVPIDLIYLSSQYKLDKTGDGIKITIDIETEGEIEQYFFNPEADLLDPNIIRELEGLVCEKLEMELGRTIEKLQQEFQVDVLAIDNYLRKYHPKLWNELEEDWEELYPNIEIVPNISTQIRRIGLTI
ncbi:spore germination B3 GerAC family protein [Alkaliphilus metalliredigens QYMF]|uniref:Spore germination B3 GerAC family protein n=1 Tax=Alkaliphilus metalliredigens (strain QYMF) TaxID=293826 RepID=A6TWV2_ALKMQ|nr:Ger(x)C family spore germination protein [Alkaliphilus metalliredigens]ABR50670.1 spore germination B3 GerAC family protein [Alkaliphilus metalliredigens QYMF]